MEKETLEERISVLEQNVATLICQSYAFEHLTRALFLTHPDREAVLDLCAQMIQMQSDLALFEPISEKAMSGRISTGMRYLEILRNAIR